MIRTNNNQQINKYTDIKVSVKIIERIHKDITYIQKNYLLTSDKQEIVDNSEIKINNVLSKYKNKEYEISKIIQEYQIQYNIESSLEKELNQDLNTCFKIEETVSKIVREIWIKSISNPNDYYNGKQFMFVVEPITIDNNPRSCYFHEKPYINARLITNNYLNINDSLYLSYQINEENFLCSSEYEMDTELNLFPTLRTISQYQDQYITVGNPDGHIVSTKTTTPREIEQNCFSRFKFSNDVTNKVILSQEHTTINGIIIINNGCNVSLNEYIYAKQLMKHYHIPQITVINSNIYNKIQMPKHVQETYVIQLLKQYLNNQISFTNQDQIPEIIEEYYHEIIAPMPFCDAAERIIASTLNTVDKKNLILKK